MKNLKLFPLPEAFSARRWDVRDGPPYTDLDRRVISAPLDQSPESLFARVHELAHVRWTPEEAAAMTAGQGLDWEVWQAVEDCRLHGLLHRARIDLTSGGLRPEERRRLCQSLLDAGDLRGASLCAAAAYGTGDWAALEASFAGGPLEGALKIGAQSRQRLLAAGLERFETTLQVARWLQAQLSRPRPENVQEGNAGDRGAAAGARPSPSDPRRDGLPFRSLYHRDPSPAAEEEEEKESGGAEGVLEFGWGPSLWGGLQLERPEPPFVPWGRMCIEEPERPLTVGPLRKGASTATDHGTCLRNPHRLALDGRVFASRRRHRGGALLIDWSGSMDLADADVERILALAPICTVAAYSAESDGGVLKILAREGRRVRPADITRPSGPSNVIDGPALEWLTRQAGPRVWLSDGGVTGLGDVQGTENQRSYDRKLWMKA
jgi:hypothetical protein